MPNLRIIETSDTADCLPIIQRWEEMPVASAGWCDFAAYLDLPHARQNLEKLQSESQGGRWRLKPKTEAAD